MTVVNPKSISGINSITTGSGSDNLLTIHTSDANNTERVRVNSSGDVIVGSGVTLSPDGDAFFTGVCTATSFVGNGSGLTNLATDLVNDTSPQLGGDLDTNSHNIILDDSHYLYLGDTSDASLFNDGSNVYLKNYDGGTDIQGSTYVQLRKFNNSDVGLKYVVDGAVELYHDGTKQCETSANGLAFPSGKGIDFSATANSSASGATMSNELLDDYEEGSWTPQIRKYASGSFGTAAGMADNGTVQRSTYTKIGNVVTLFLHWDGFQVSDANYAALGGLPFDTANSGGGGGNVGFTDAFTNNPNNGLLVGSGGDLMYFYVNSNAWNGWSTSSNRALYLQATYLTS